MSIQRQPFGTMPDGAPVEWVTLANRAGLQAGIISYGGILVSLRVPDRKGQLDDVVLGFDTLGEYLRDNPYFGAIVGRFAGLIARARFKLDGAVYELPRNDGPNHLHGGRRGFDKVLWKIREAPAADGPGVELSYLSPDGEEGYPGNLAVTVTYTLTDQDDLRIAYAATTDQPTVLNLTHHAYFNLAGQGEGDILGHELALDADRFNPIDRMLLPAGDPAPVRGTPLDFTRPVAIGARIRENHPQLIFGQGYDHNWILNGHDGSLRPAARVYESGTGRILEMLTTEPGVQVYTANALPDGLRGKYGRRYRKWSGLCLEAQHFPDSPNRPEFPSTVLRPGTTYQQTTVYRFRTD